MAATAKCPQCGKDVRPSDPQCRACGEILSGALDGPAQGPAGQPQAPEACHLCRRGQAEVPAEVQAARSLTYTRVIQERPDPMKMAAGALIAGGVGMAVVAAAEGGYRKDVSRQSYSKQDAVPLLLCRPCASLATQAAGPSRRHRGVQVAVMVLALLLGLAAMVGLAKVAPSGGAVAGMVALLILLGLGAGACVLLDTNLKTRFRPLTNHLIGHPGVRSLLEREASWEAVTGMAWAAPKEKGVTERQRSQSNLYLCVPGAIVVLKPLVGRVKPK